MKSSNDPDQEKKDPAGTGSNLGVLVELQFALMVDSVQRMLGARVAMLEGTVFALNLRLSKAEGTLADALFAAKGHTPDVPPRRQEGSATHHVTSDGPAEVSQHVGTAPVP